MATFAELRERMIEQQIAARGLDNPALLAAFRAVPREDFISGNYADYAYRDSPLPIESGQTISQPYIVALTIDAAEIGNGDKVLEVNVYTPGGAQACAELYGLDVGEVVVRDLERRLAVREVYPRSPGA